ncbi:MAG: glycosyltransferase family 4 protein, partial [Clostridia bacterium]|nr:glycosyltransferase family 4 protein [Clostridia bacterium]
MAEATIGGVRRHLRDLSLGLADAGWQVSVACARRRDPGFAHDVDGFRARGLNVYDVPMVRRPAPWGDLAAVRRLGAVIRACRPDVIHAHSTKAGLIARLAARRSGIPVCYTPHGFAFAMQVPGPLRRMYREVERLAIPLTAR